MKRSIAIALAALSISAAECVRAQPQTAWVLMSREGECAEIAEAQRRRFSELPPIASPEQFADEWRRRGVGVTVAPMPSTRGEVVMVEVPAAQLTLMFAQRSRCTSVNRRAR